MAHNVAPQRKNLLLTLPYDLHQQLNDAARQSGETKTAFVRAALRAYLAANAPTTTNSHRSPAKGTVAP